MTRSDDGIDHLPPNVQRLVRVIIERLCALAPRLQGAKGGRISWHEKANGQIEVKVQPDL